MANASAATLATDADVDEIRVVSDPEKASLQALSIRLNDAAAIRVRQYTTEHVGDLMVISVGDRVVERFTVRDPIDGPTLLVTGATDGDVAEMRAKLCGG